jgi:hypothetical protein
MLTNGAIPSDYINSQMSQGTLIFDAIHIIVEALYEMQTRACDSSDNRFGLCDEFWKQSDSLALFETIVRQAYAGFYDFFFLQ